MVRPEADTDEERCHFEQRTDPAEDQLHADADQETRPSSPLAKRPRKRCKSTPVSSHLPCV